MHLTLYRGARDTTPAQVDDFAWPDVVDAIRELLARDPAPEKRDVLAIAPHRLRDGTTRAAASVAAVTALAIDVDGCDLAALDRAVHDAGIAALVYGSPSDDDTAPARRVRVIAPTTREMTPAECDRARIAFADALGLAPGQGVETALGAERLFFVGRALRDEAKRRDLPVTPRETLVYDGTPVDVDALLARPLRAAWTMPRHLANDTTTAATTDRAALVPATDAYAVATAAVVAAIGDWRDHAGRKHALCGALGGVLRKSPGWTRDACAAVVRAWLADADETVDVDAGVRWACGAWDRMPEDVSGRAALAAIVGDDTAALVETAAMLPWHARREATTPSATPTPSCEDDGALLRVVDRTKPPPTLHFVVPGLDLAPGKVSVIQSFANAGKTPFALLLAICVAAGVPFLGHDVVQRPTLYLDFEGGALSQEREARICAGLGLARAEVPLTFACADTLSEPLLDEVEARMRLDGAGVVFVDTYTSALPADVLTFNDAAFRSWAMALARMAERIDALAVLLVHETKAGDGSLRAISGHASFAGAVQAAIALSRPCDDDKTLVAVKCSREAKRGFAPFAVRWSDAPCEAAPDGMALVATRVEAAQLANVPRSAPNAARAQDKARRIVEAGTTIIRGASRGVYTSRRELVALGGAGRNAGEEAIARLLRGGLLDVRAGEYAVTEAGVAASALRVAEVLGVTAGFTR